MHVLYAHLKGEDGRQGGGVGGFPSWPSVEKPCLNFTRSDYPTQTSFPQIVWSYKILVGFQSMIGGSLSLHVHVLLSLVQSFDL